MSAEPKFLCRHCKKELPPGHTGPCPYCGQMGKDSRVSIKAGLVVKANVGGTHKPKPSSTSLAILGLLVTIFLAIIVPIFLYLLPFSMGINCVILIGFLLIVTIISCWRRYNIWMLIRKLEGKIGGEKRF